MPSKLDDRSCLSGGSSPRDVASIPGEVIKQDDRDGQSNTTALHVNSSALLSSTPISPARSASPTGHTLPAGTSSTPTTLVECLWDRAYDDLKTHDAALIQAYEKILSSKLGCVMSEQNIIAQNETYARQNQMRQLIHQVLNNMEKDAKAKEAFGTVISAKDIITSALQATPQAALAWAGLYVALEMIQSPIDNSTKAICEGIEYVPTRMNMYWHLSGAVLKENAEDGSSSSIRPEREIQLISFYKALLSYEIKSVCSYYHDHGLAILRDIAGVDDWHGDMQAIKDAERIFHDDFETLARLQPLCNMNLLYPHGLTKEDRQCIRDLGLSDPSDDKKRIEQTKGGLLRESCTWILDNAEYQQWRDDKESRLLWIKGDPGKGKTMLLCGIIDELNKSSNHSGLVSYFFCQATDQKLNNASATLRGLIFMLVKQQPSLISHLRKKYDHAGGKLFEGPGTWVALSDIFTAILQDPELKSSYIVVDALDECLSDLEKLLDLIVHISNSEARLKWIVSSRNWPKIGEGLRNAEQKFKLSLELNETYISNAVNIYIEKKVDELSSLKGYDHKTDIQVREYLLDNANATFLWVALVCQNLTNHTQRGILEMLGTFPPGLDPLYERMTEQITATDDNGDGRDASLCKQILATMMIVYRPVTLRELGCIIEIPEERSADIEFLKDSVSLCGSFLTVSEDIVYFVHQSAKDYLSMNETVFSSSGRENVHHTIFSLSLHAMNKALRKNIYDLAYLGSLMDNRINIPDGDPLSSIRYSCVHWVDHLLEGYTGGMKAMPLDDLDDEGVVSSFLRKHLLHWLEALGLLQQVPAGVTSVAALEGLLSAQSLEGELLRFVQDTRRFIHLNQRAIEMAPLQIYSSALVFSPTQSLVRKVFHQEIPPWIQRCLVMGDSWTPCLQAPEDHTDGVTSVAFSADGNQIAPGPLDNTVKSWDISISASARKFYGHEDCIESISLSPDGRQVASASHDKNVKVWDIETGACVQTIEGDGYRVRSVIFLKHGQVAFESDGRTVKIWDVVTGACIQTLEGHHLPVRSIACSADGQYLASASYDHTARIWDVAAGVSVHKLWSHRTHVSSVAFSLDVKQLASGSFDRAIKIWDVTTGACTHTLKGHKSRVTSVAFSADGRYLASGSSDKSVRVWDIATEACIQIFDVGRVYHLSFDPTMNSRIYSSHGILNLDLDPTTLDREPGKDRPSQPIGICGYGIDRNNEWILKDGKPLLWMPTEYRPTAAHVVGSQIIVGCDSGRLFIMKFSDAGPDS